MKRIGIGVVGLGMGANVLPINHVADSVLEVRGVCDVDEEKMKELARKFNIPLVTKVLLPV